MKKIHLKIRPTILFILILVVSISIVISLGLQYYFSKQLAFKGTSESVEQIAEKTKLISKNSYEASNNLLSLLELSSAIHDAPKEQERHLMLKKLTRSLLHNNLIYALYIGYSNGDFYEVINLENEGNLKEKFESKKNERWLVIKIIKKDDIQVETKHYMDKSLNYTRTLSSVTQYNPTHRLWYKKAMQSNEMIKTKPYLFANLGSMGVTYSKRIESSNNVIAFDVSLKSISRFLKEQEFIKGTQLYIFDDNGKVIASNISEDSYPANINEVLKNSSKNKLSTVIFNEADYSVSNIPLNENNEVKTYLSILVPQDAMLKPYNEKIYFSLVLNILFLLILIPIVWLATKLIVRPIDKLMEENKKIINQDFDNVKVIETPVCELHYLSESFYTMASAIKKHEEAQVKLMDSFIEVLAGAIDNKSKYTGGHCNRVPILSVMLAQKASSETSGIFKDFELSSKEELREISIAAWLHDCGKVTTPEYVVDKATKLETIYNRIHEIRTRFEVIHRDLIIESFYKIQDGEDEIFVNAWLEKEHLTLKSDFEFISKANKGSEFMSQEDKQRVHDIAQRVWIREFDNTLGLSQEEQKRHIIKTSKKEYLLADKQEHIIQREDFSKEEHEKFGFKIEVPEDLYNLGEVYNLTIEKGTLTPEERFKINEHMIMTIKMLEKLPFPKHLQRVPEYAGAHHETLIGTGYPKKLTKEQMSIPARIMAVADIFEALTASDRPYKEAKKLSEAIKILSYMAKDKHIDEDIFNLFLSSGVYLEYAHLYLNKEQIDEIIIKEYLLAS